MSSRTSPVRQDEKGLFVITNGSKYRPGKVAGYCHVYRMDASELKKDDRVVVRNICGTPLAKVVCYEGPEDNRQSVTLHWHSDGELK